MWFPGGAYAQRDKAYESPPAGAYVRHTVFLLESRYPIKFGIGRPDAHEHIVGCCLEGHLEAILQRYNSEHSPPSFMESMDNANWPWQRPKKRKRAKWWDVGEDPKEIIREIRDDDADPAYTDQTLFAEEQDDEGEPKSQKGASVNLGKKKPSGPPPSPTLGPETDEKPGVTVAKSDRTPPSSGRFEDRSQRSPSVLTAPISARSVHSSANPPCPPEGGLPPSPPTAPARPFSEESGSDASHPESSAAESSSTKPPGPSNHVLNTDAPPTSAPTEREEPTPKLKLSSKPSVTPGPQREAQLAALRALYIPSLSTTRFWRPLLTFTLSTRPLALTLLRLSKAHARGLPFYSSIPSDERKEPTSFSARMRCMRINRMTGLATELARVLAGARGGLIGIRFGTAERGRGLDGEGLADPIPWEKRVLGVGVGNWYPRADDIKEGFRADESIGAVYTAQGAEADNGPFEVYGLDECGRRVNDETGEVFPWPEPPCLEEPRIKLTPLVLDEKLTAAEQKRVAKIRREQMAKLHGRSLALHRAQGSKHVTRP
jgi:hypothetical protein